MGVLLGPKPSSGIQYGLIGALESTVWMKYDLLGVPTTSGFGGTSEVA